jgi:hypothetical protein
VLGGERVTLMTIVSAITIVGGVILVLVDRRAAAPIPPAPEHVARLRIRNFAMRPSAR